MMIIMNYILGILLLISTYKFLFLFSYSDIMINIYFNFYLSDFSMSIYMDKFKMLFIMTIIIIYYNVYLFSIKYLSNFNKNNFFYFSLLMIFIFSMILFLVNYNLFFIFLGWDGLGVSSFFLINYYMSSSTSGKSMIVNMTNRLGDFFLMIFFILMFLDKMNIKLNKMITIMIFICTLAAMTKSSQFPFISWLPFAMAAPTPISTLVHSSTLVTAGVFMLIQVFPSNSMFVWESMPMFLKFIFYCSMITIIISSLLSIMMFDIKKMIALSTMNHLGIMMLLLSMGMKELSMLHLISHAYFKSSLFLSFGIIMLYSSHSLEYKNINLFNYINNINFNMMKISILSLNGLFMFTGFFSKEKMFLMGFTMSNILLMKILYYFVMMMSMIYSMRMIFLMNNVNNISNKFFYNSSNNMILTMLSQSGMSILFGLMIINKMMVMNNVIYLLLKKNFLFMMINFMFMLVFSIYINSMFNKKKEYFKKFLNMFVLDYMISSQIKMTLINNNLLLVLENGMNFKFFQPEHFMKNYSNNLLYMNKFKSMGNMMLLFFLIFILSSYIFL